ncbi:N-terminal phage integrase SAM-like domain-containing protein [Mycobacterium sp. ITM-2016-00318]|uniref:N-terminal phage integrase SAM-like domain-containing protein n=1 Tax=Mycobacterium sp. ITM-2016-00318 TaxID=2099693 RepID=UPI0013047F67|nr:N-terminal phage integrase SAM-like domain-containing protein [Mycobacterium sp. ITM-2016-00318]WNG95282.1 N-terminal phage integrase SAM-like domain-containing protein [Mycobacterium sp. ITM-2016-00318]
MAVTRNQRVGIDDRWTRRVKGPDGRMVTADSALKGKVTRWRVRWVVDGREHSKVFDRKVDAQAHLDGLTAEVVRGTYVSPRKSAALFKTVADECLQGKGSRKPKTVAGYNSLLDTLILPRWGDMRLADITHGELQRWINAL